MHFAELIEREDATQITIHRKQRPAAGERGTPVVPERSRENQRVDGFLVIAHAA
jgi:hypothetical protein